VISCAGQPIGCVNRGPVADESHQPAFLSFLFVRSASAYGDTERSWLVALLDSPYGKGGGSYYGYLDTHLVYVGYRHLYLRTVN
jgi:hypothetical protein